MTLEHFSIIGIKMCLFYKLFIQCVLLREFRRFFIIWFCLVYWYLLLKFIVYFAFYLRIISTWSYKFYDWYSFFRGKPDTWRTVTLTLNKIYLAHITDWIGISTSQLFFHSIWYIYIYFFTTPVVLRKLLLFLFKEKKIFRNFLPLLNWRNPKNICI